MAVADLLRWRTTQVVEAVDISLTDREANELYSDIYRMQRDLPGARENYSMVFAVYDTLNAAGVDGTRMAEVDDLTALKNFDRVIVTAEGVYRQPTPNWTPFIVLSDGSTIRAGVPYKIEAIK